MKPEIKKLLILNAPYLLFVYLFDKVGQAVRLSPGLTSPASCFPLGTAFRRLFKCRAEPTPPGPAYRHCGGCHYPACGLRERQEREEIPQRHGVRFCPLGQLPRI